jgi:urease accessory protein
MIGDALLSLLQFSDGLFPTGAFAHSFGLETYVQTGDVCDAGSAEKFIRAHLIGAVAPSDAVAAVNALRAARESDLAACIRIDEILDAMKPAAQARQASRQLGRQMLRVAAAILDDPFTAEFWRVANENRTPCHHALIFGIVGAGRNWDIGDAARAYLYASASTLTAAAVRLIPLGQLQGQTIIHNLIPIMDSLATQAVQMDICRMTTFAPGLEIAAMRHARLEARLFRS